MPLTFNAIYLGNVTTILDPTEGNNLAENAGSTAFVGRTFGSISAPLTASWVSLTSVNMGGTATVLEQNNNIANDRLTVTTATGSVTRIFDAGANYVGRITYVDGTQSATNLTLSIIQTTNGDVFLVPALSGPTNTALTFDAIRSVTLTSVQNNNFSGMQTDRPLLNFLTCFTRGTELASPTGPRRVETLRRGQWLSTLDNGPRKVRWVGSRRVSGAELAEDYRLRPVRIAKGALGCGLPERDLLVSRQHRVLVNSPIVGRMAGCAEVLVAAHHLVGLPGIELVAPEDGVEYWHVLFEGHEILISEGAPTESLWPGEQAVEALGESALREIRYAMPHLLHEDGPAMTPARPFVEGKTARKMADRHVRNGKAPLAKAPRPATWTAKDRATRHVA